MADIDLHHFLPVLLDRFTEQVNRDLDRLCLDRFDLDPIEWRILCYLNLADNCSVRDVHHQLDMEKSKVSRATDRLEKSGLIDKHTHGSDRRLLRLALTDDGHDRLSAMIPVLLDFERDLARRLGLGSAASLRSTAAQYLQESRQK